jgi:predicted ATP-binding protein involved in virulence
MSDPVTNPVSPLPLAPLRSVKIENFRGIRYLDLTLDPRVTVLFGSNAAGKTTVLDALAIGLGAIVSRIPQAKGRGFAESGDLRIPYLDRQEVDERAGVACPYGHVELQSASGLTWGVTTWRSQADRAKHKGKATARELNDRLDAMILETLDTPPGASMPPMALVAAYGNQRAGIEMPLRERDFRTEFRRLEAFDESLVAKPRFKAVFEWFRMMEDEERRQREHRRDFNYRLPELEWVRQAVGNAGLRCRNPRVATRPIRMLVDFEHVDGGREPLDIKSLSDGYRTHFALVVDMARRMVQLNPTDDLQDPQRGTNSAAVILIDELDLHLDPTWQAQVLQGLQQAFPHAQFILTTHSEQVLGSVKLSCVRQLLWQDGEIIAQSAPSALWTPRPAGIVASGLRVQSNRACPPLPEKTSDDS